MPDLQNNTEQSKEFMRRADLSIEMTATKGPPSELIAEKLGHAPPAASLRITATLRNKGSKATTSLFLEVLVTTSIVHYGRSERTLPDGTGYVVYRMTWDYAVLIPNGEPTLSPFDQGFNLVDGVFAATILWRAYDLTDAYPKDDYGRVDLAWNDA